MLREGSGGKNDVECQKQTNMMRGRDSRVYGLLSTISAPNMKRKWGWIEHETIFE